MVFLHRDGASRASFHTEAALDAPGFIFENDCGQVEFLGFFHGNIIERFNQVGDVLVSRYFIEPRHSKARFWTDVDASAAKDTSAPIEDGKEMTLEAPDSLLDRHLFRKAQFYFAVN